MYIQKKLSEWVKHPRYDLFKRVVLTSAGVRTQVHDPGNGVDRFFHVVDSQELKAKQKGDKSCLTFFHKEFDIRRLRLPNKHGEIIASSRIGYHEIWGHIKDLGKVVAQLQALGIAYETYMGSKYVPHDWHREMPFEDERQQPNLPNWSCSGKRSTYWRGFT